MPRDSSEAEMNYVQCKAVVKSTLNEPQPYRCSKVRSGTDGLCTQHAYAVGGAYVPSDGWRDIGGLRLWPAGEIVRAARRSGASSAGDGQKEGDSDA